MKYISQALERLKEKDPKGDQELSLIERILTNEPDPKTACIFALDLIFVGIDTVSIFIKHKILLAIKNGFLKILIERSIE